jgi:hypothetical protein
VLLGVVIESGAMWTAIAALGSASLAILGQWLLQDRKARKEGASAHKDEIKRRSVQLMAASVDVHSVASALHEKLRHESGVTAGLRSPPDPLKLHAEIRQYIAPVYEAEATLRLEAPQDIIEAAHELMGACSAALGFTGKSSASEHQITTRFGGVKWTDEEASAFGNRLDEIGRSRGAFARVARDYLGADALALETQPKSAAPVTSGIGGFK